MARRVPSCRLTSAGSGFVAVRYEVLGPLRAKTSWVCGPRRRIRSGARRSRANFRAPGVRTAEKGGPGPGRRLLARRFDQSVEGRALDADEATISTRTYGGQADHLENATLDPRSDRPVRDAGVRGGFLERQQPRRSGFLIHSTGCILAIRAGARPHLARTWPGIRLDQVGAHIASPVVSESHVNVAPHVEQRSSPVRTRPPHSP